MSGGQGEARLCAYCGGPLPPAPCGGTPRRFCARICRYRWHNEQATQERSRQVQAARQEAARAAGCVDCKGPLDLATVGMLPKRCKACKAAYDRVRLDAAEAAHRTRQSEQKQRRRRRLRCLDCKQKLDVPVKRVGRLPQRCQSCRDERNRQLHCADQRAKRAKGAEARRRRRWPLLWGGG